MNESNILSLKEKRALNTQAFCENLHCGTGLTIAKLENANSFIVYQCEYKSNEYIYNWTTEDILNMSQSEFIEKLRAGVATIPENHDYKVYPSCKALRGECINNGNLDVVRVNVSSACNIKCKFCDIKSLKPIFPKEKELYFDILNKLQNAHLKYLQLTGDGEPFIYKKETLEFIKTLTTDTCKILVIFTNNTLLDKEDIELIHNVALKTGIKMQIMCSCSAITPETYRTVHCNDNFDKVVENIKLISKYDMLQNINFVIMPDNLHELEFYKQFWLEQGIDKTAATIIHDYCYPGATKFVYDSPEYKRFIENS